MTTIGHPFSFSSKTREKAQKIISHYPNGREKSALVPILDLAQRQAGGWLSREVLDYVALFMNLPIIHVYEVASFYSMFNLKPVGTHFVQVCTTTPCWLRGSDQILSACKKVLGEKAFDGVSTDGHFSVKEVECLGACANAPMVQINDDYYEDLDEESMTRILKDLQAGRDVKAGSQMGRVCSAPLEDLPLLDSKPPKTSPKPLLKSLKKED
ncbi:MAG: NADH-quinone oxidoreductase subunit NuoE [Alphaproteobacteria bacterium]|nr:NADH-quinone oxidoreductase subunit NuoE [Alphaproteobacteria bacterium]